MDQLNTSLNVSWPFLSSLLSGCNSKATPNPRKSDDKNGQEPGVELIRGSFGKEIRLIESIQWVYQMSMLVQFAPRRGFQHSNGVLDLKFIIKSWENVALNTWANFEVSGYSVKFHKYFRILPTLVVPKFSASLLSFVFRREFSSPSTSLTHNSISG